MASPASSPIATLGLTFFYGGVAMYVVAAAAALRYLQAGGEKARSLARGLADAGFVAHTAFLVLWGSLHWRLPGYARFEALAALLWCAALTYVVLDLSLRVRALPSFVLPLIAAGGVAIALFVRPEAEASTTATSWWLPVHVAASLLGAADFVVAFAVAAMYLVQQRLLKRGAVGPVMERLPSLDALDRLNYRVVALGMPVFTLALVSGVVLAVAKRPDWWASWLVAASFLAWALYAVLLHVRLRAGWRGPKVAYLTVLGFLLVLAIVCGLALFGDPLHTMGRKAAPGGHHPPAAEGQRDAP